MLYRFSSGLLLFAAFSATLAVGQAPAPQAETAESGSAAPAKTAEIPPDLTDPSVLRAQLNMDRVRGLVRQGVLPQLSLTKAQDELNDALDMSILRFSASASDLLPEQADQMVTVAERMFLRRQRRATQNAQLAANGVISRSEAEAAGGDVMSAKIQLDLAIDRARLVKEMAAQKALAQVETDAETHPEQNGRLYTRYDGNGVFTRSDFDKLSAAYRTTFGHPIPVSADGQTEVHRAMGLNHAGRIDIALTPDQPEGAWLIRYLERHHLPYYAFKAAVAHKATGAHIHLGPGSTRLTAAARACCGS